MKILGIDTSTKFLSLGVLDGSRVYEYNLELGRRHSSLLATSIKRAVEALEWKISDIDYFACGLGPGSFTGVRIGLAAIKALGLALKKPLVGISTLDILAGNARLTEEPGAFIVPVLDARRNLVYYSIYKNKDGSARRIAPYALATAQELCRKLKPNSVLLGDGLSLYKETILKKTKKIRALDKDYWYPAGRNIVSLAQERIKKGKVNNVFNIKPIYLYPKECQVKK